MSSPNLSHLLRASLFILILGLASIPSPAFADTFVVNTLDDTNDGLCDSNHCSLREAIDAANNFAGPDTISFAGLDATSGDVTIFLNSALNPLLDNGTTIDGTTVIGYAGVPIVNVVKGSGVIEEGIAIQGSNCVVRGLSMAGFFGVPGSPDPKPEDLIGGAIVISGSGNMIESNVLGWGAFPNSRGVWLAGSGNSVIGNVISGNSVGIHMSGPNQIIRGNKIGTDRSGTVAVPNGFGIYESLNAGGGHFIGGTNPSDRNLVSANNIHGIQLKSENSVIQGNFIGTNASGTAALGNNGSGIRISSDNNLIGGPGSGNLISGNGSDGVILSSANWVNSNIVVQGNIVGTDISGTNPIPNGGDGIFFIDGGGGIIGGLSPGEGNLSAFNAGDGIEAEGPNQQILGNTSFNNGFAGVEINGDALISQNSIYDNGDVGIYASLGGMTNPPVFNPNSSGTVTGTACPNCTIEIFIADPDPSGAGEGKEYLGTVTTSNNGDFSMALPSGLSYCTQITATATDGRPRTSRFSQNIAVNCQKFGPYYLIPIWSFIIIVCGGIGILVHRLRPHLTPLLIPGSFVFGALLGGGLLMLANSLPNVIIDFTPEEQVPYSGQMPTCDTYLDPNGLFPQDGAMLESNGDPVLEWVTLGNLPGGAIRWNVELVEVGEGAATQVTSQNSIPMSAFSMIPLPGSAYEWLLVGQKLLQDGQTWLTFCAPQTPWTFAIEDQPDGEGEGEELEEPQPTSTSEAMEEPICTAPLITALMNMTCRKGPLQAYEEMGYLLQGETAIPEGVSTDGFWYWIPNPDWLGYCFVASNGVQAECVEGLPPIAAPPLPTGTPTQPACLPEFDRSTCNDVGGVWSADTGTCQCPG